MSFLLEFCTGGQFPLPLCLLSRAPSLLGRGGDLSWYPEPLDPMAGDPPEGGLADGLLEWQWIDPTL